MLGHRQRRDFPSGGGRAYVMTAQALQRTSAGEGPPVVFGQRRDYVDAGLPRLKGPPQELSAD